MPEEKPKIVIVGVGFLMQFIKPCYHALLGPSLQDSIVGTTATAATIPAKQAALGFEIRHQSVLPTLREEEPDIIMLAPPPSAIGDLSRDILATYYEEQRAANQPLPLLYSYAPDPTVTFYPRTLGEDVLAVNILPNMTYDPEVNPQRAYSVITYANKSTWPAEQIALLERFLAPLGSILEVDPEDLTAFLGAYVVCHLIYNLVFSIEDALGEVGITLPSQQIARAMLTSEADLDDQLLRTVRSCSQAFQAGLIRYLMEAGFSESFACDAIHREVEAFLHLQLKQDRAQIRKQSSEHATRGGLLETAENYYDDHMAAQARSVITAIDQGKIDTAFLQTIARFSCDAARHLSLFSDGYAHAE